MSFIKKFTVHLAVSFLSLCLMTAAGSSAFQHIFGTPDRLTSALDNSGTYSALSDTLVDEVVSNISGTGQPIAVTINQTAKRVVTPAEIQRISEDAIDSTYAWLEGEAERPEPVSVASLQDQVAKTAAANEAKRVEQLPVCTSFQQLQASVSLANLTCRPPGVDVSNLQQQYLAQLQPQAALTNETLPFSGEESLATVPGAPELFRFQRFLPWIAGTGIVGSILIILALERPKRVGVKRISRSLLGSGLVLGLGAGIGLLLTNRIDPDQTINSLQAATVLVVSDLAGAYLRILAIFASIYVLVGTIGLLGLRFSRTKQTHNQTFHTAPQPFAVPLEQGTTHTTPHSNSVSAPNQTSEIQNTENGGESGIRTHGT